MTGPEYLEFRRQAYRASGNWSSPADDSKIGLNAKMLSAIQNGQYTNWPELLINNGLQQDYQLGISGGSEKTKVYFSGNYYKENGILKNDAFRRYTGRLNVDQIINNWMKIGMQTQVAYSDNDQRRDPFNVASKIAPLGSPYNSDGTLDLFPALGTEVNPLADEQPGAYNKNVENTRGTVATYLELSPLTGLNFKSTFAATLSDNDQGTFYARNTIDGKGASSRSEMTGAKNRFFSWENIATYKKDIQDHSLSLTGITSYNSNVNVSNYVGGSNQLFENQFYYNLSGVALPYYGSQYQKYDLLSYAGRFHYGFKGKYLLDLTGRTDGSSKLGTGHKWAFFPAAALAWRVSDEAFLQSQNFLNELKLRLSYGVAGNDGISPYGTQNS
jgi:TonB-dependent starch-binding outer membrane protein SusC